MTAGEPAGAPGGDEPRPRRVPVKRQVSRRTPRDRLRRTLASPGAMRQAFLLHEVLGPPAALRQHTPDRPV